MPEWQQFVPGTRVPHANPALEDLFESHQQPKAKGILPYWCRHRGMAVSMYRADPRPAGRGGIEDQAYSSR